MRFQVPQFIETETKLVGPLTLKQFLWIGSGGALLFLSFMILPIYVFIPTSIVVAVIFGALAFIKIDNIPLFNYVVYGLSYFANQKKYFFVKKEPGIKDELNDLIPKKSFETEKKQEQPTDGKILFKMERKPKPEKKKKREEAHTDTNHHNNEGKRHEEDPVDKALQEINKF